VSRGRRVRDTSQRAGDTECKAPRVLSLSIRRANHNGRMGINPKAGALTEELEEPQKLALGCSGYRRFRSRLPAPATALTGPSSQSTRTPLSTYRSTRTPRVAKSSSSRHPTVCQKLVFWEAADDFWAAPHRYWTSGAKQKPEGPGDGTTMRTVRRKEKRVTEVGRGSGIRRGNWNAQAQSRHEKVRVAAGGKEVFVASRSIE